MKKGYFFVLDAFVALTVVVLSLVLIFSFHTQKPYQIQSITLSDDTMDVLSSMKVYEINNEWVFSQYTNGSQNISNPDSTLLEQAAIFYLTNRVELGDRFVGEVTSGILPERYGSLLRLYNSTNEYNVLINSGDVTQDDARMLVVSKRLLLVMADDEQLLSPIIAEVRVWE
ncbi:hypothetical protein KY320_02465 [Candidatus Woesearchaeota archaeon]|nr:hypothetical protein [Candidatus Woesearchaeota archaeon]